MNSQQRRQQRRAMERAREIERNRVLADLGMSASQKAAVTALAKKVEKEDSYREIQVEDDASTEAVNQVKDAAEKLATSKTPPIPINVQAGPPAPEVQKMVQEAVEQAVAKKEETPQKRSAFAFASKMVDKIKSAPQAVQNASVGFADQFRIGKPTEEQRKARQDILKINNQLITTTKIIEANKEELEKLATTDASVKALLESLKSDELKTIKSIQDRIIRGEDISAQDSAILIKSLEKVTAQTSATKVSLDASLGTITDSFSSLILNDDLDRENRREMLKELTKIYDSSEVQNQLSEAQKAEILNLRTLAAKDINFSKDQTQELNKIFTTLKGDDLDKVKLRGTLKDLNESIESAVLTQEALKEKLDKQDEMGNTLRTKLEDGIKGVGKNLKAASIDALLSQVGLGGLGIGDALSDVGLKDIFTMGKNLPGKLGGLLGKFPGANKLGGALGGLLGKLPGGFGKFGGMAGGAIGKLALPLLAAKGIFDFGSGFIDPNEIAGLKEGEKAGLGTRTQAGVSSLLSGLTFGLVDAKDIFSGISTGLEFMFGKDGILTLAYSFFKEKIGSIASFVKEQFTEMGQIFGQVFSRDGFFTGIWRLAKKLFEFSPMGLMVKAAQALLPSVFGADGFFAKVIDFITNIPKSIMGVVEEIFGGPESFVKKISDAFTSIGEFFFGEQGLFSVNFIKDTLKGAASSFLPDSISNKIFGTDVKADLPSFESTSFSTEPQASTMAPNPLDSFRENQAQKDRDAQAMLDAAKAGKTIVVPAAATKQAQTLDRSPKIDDVGLAVMQTQLAGI